MLQDQKTQSFSYLRSTTQIISYIIFLFINFLFSYKYGSRFCDYALQLSFLYIIVLVFLPFAINKISERFFNWKVISISLLLISVFFIVSFLMINVEKLRVDRWLMINTFLDNLINGCFPYIPKPDNSVPGPFPFYYILAFPFYIVGEIGYMSLFGFLGFIYLFIKMEKLFNRNVFFAIILLIFSAAFYWEMFVRSTIMVNVVVLLWYLFFLGNMGKVNLPKLIGMGVVGGLVLSTRSIVALPIIIYFVYEYLKKKKLKYFLILSISAIFTFMLTFLPLYLWDPILFKEYNPILLQANFLPVTILPLIVIISIILGLFCKNINNVYFYSGLVLFTSVLISMMFNASEYGFSKSLFASYFDISYFNFSIPFLVLSVLNPTNINNEKRIFL